MRESKKDRKHLLKYIAGFGTAVSSLAITDDADAAIVVLTPVPESVPYQSFTNGAAIDLGLDGPYAFDFYQFNDSVGKSMYGFLQTTTGGTPVTFSYNIAGFRSVNPGSLITTGQFNPAEPIFALGTQAVTLGFVTLDNQVGWIQVDPGGPQDDVTFLAAAYNDTPGGTIEAGMVPEPNAAALSGLAALALGAVTTRRRRREKQEAA